MNSSLIGYNSPPSKDLLNFAQQQHILALDDEIPILKMLSLALRFHGFKNVTIESDPQKALQTIANTPTSLLITDYSMLSLVGPQVVDLARSKTPSYRGQVLFISGSFDDELRGLTLEGHITALNAKYHGKNFPYLTMSDNFLAKPFEAKTIRAAVVGLCAKLENAPVQYVPQIKADSNPSFPLPAYNPDCAVGF